VIDDVRMSIGSEIVKEVLAANRRPAASGVANERLRR
jgi:hypothetical protein